MTITELTDRQQQVKDRLEQEPPMSAVEIAEDLGISRNAVYQQIQAPRRKGVLERDFTPSGLPARESGLSRNQMPEPLIVQQTLMITEHIAQLRRLADELEQSIS